MERTIEISPSATILGGMQCPCCGVELGLVPVKIEPVEEIEVSKKDAPKPVVVQEVHSDFDCRLAVRYIKDSAEELYFEGARIKWAFGLHGLMVTCCGVGQRRVREWAKVVNRAGRPVLLDNLWGS